MWRTSFPEIFMTKKKFLTGLVSLIILFSPACPLSAGPGEKSSVYIMCYHAFLDRKDIYSFSESQLKAQLQDFRKKGFRFIEFDDLKYNRVNGTRNILISSDDGNRSVYNAYFNVMKSMGIKPMLAIYPAVINKKKYALTWKQLKELSDEGCHIAAHGFNHRFLKKKLYTDSIKLFKREIFLPKLILEKKLKKKIESFVYPYGATCPEALKLIREAGYTHAFTIVPGPAAVPLKENLQIHRLMMTKRDTKWILASMYKGRTNKISRSADPAEQRKKEISSAVKPLKKKRTVLSKMSVNEIIIAPGRISSGRTYDYTTISPVIEDIKPVYPVFNGKEYDVQKDFEVYSKIEQEKPFLTGIKAHYLQNLIRFRELSTRLTRLTSDNFKKNLNN